MSSSSDDPTNDASSEERSDAEQRKALDLTALSSAQMLPTALSAAVPLRVFEIYAHNGPTEADWTRLQHTGRLLAERGDVLLYRSPHADETAHLFNALAEALAILSFLPGGIPFGEQHFEALQILTGFLGEERANRYISQVRQGRAE